LPHQQIARPMQHQLALPLGRFDLHGTRGQAPYRIADRLGIGRVGGAREYSEMLWEVVQGCLVT